MNRNTSKGSTAIDFFGCKDSYILFLVISNESKLGQRSLVSCSSCISFGLSLFSIIVVENKIMCISKSY